MIYNGWGGIRTHGRLTTSPVFKTGAINRSATHPGFKKTNVFIGLSVFNVESLTDAKKVRTLFSTPLGAKAA